MRIGLFGGSFNPMHNGHIMVANSVVQEFGLAKLLLMVACDPPHKQLNMAATGAQRLEMAAIAAGGVQGLEPCGLELERGGVSYTIDTLKELRRRYPGAELFTVVGADMLASLPTWREPEGLFGLSSFIGVARGGMSQDVANHAAALRARYGASILLASAAGPELSSTMVRERVNAALPTEGMLAPGVEQYIYENALYMGDWLESAVARLRAGLSPGRFSHSMGAAREAVRLAARFNVDGQRARLAAVLHDCMKVPRPAQLEQLTKLVAMGRIPAARAAELEGMQPQLLHGPLGALVARWEYGVQDGGVLNAIANHTVGRAGMSELEKVVYLADKVEPTRAHAGVLRLRLAAGEGLNQGVLACMDSAVEHVLKSGQALDKTVLEAREYIKTHFEGR